MAQITDSFLETYARSDALDLAGLVRHGEVTSAELVEAAITLIERYNPTLNAVIHRLYDMARAQAHGRQKRALAGVPFCSRNWLIVGGAPNTNSCFFQGCRRHLRHRSRAPHEGGRTGAVGKSNAPENGWSITTEPKLYGATKNPWKEGITPGGSSGGAAAAIASRMVPIAEASDGAGSIRIPASCCGIVGLKPSRGRVAWRLSATTGMAAPISCAARERYATPPPIWMPWPARCRATPIRRRFPMAAGSASSRAEKAANRRFVTPPNGTAIDPEVRATVLATVAALERLGHDVEEHDMPLDANECGRPTPT
jgi:amidase